MGISEFEIISVHEFKFKRLVSRPSLIKDSRILPRVYPLMHIMTNRLNHSIDQPQLYASPQSLNVVNNSTHLLRTKVINNIHHIPRYQHNNYTTSSIYLTNNRMADKIAHSNRKQLNIQIFI